MKFRKSAVVKYIETKKDLPHAKKEQKSECPRTRTRSCFSGRDLISTHAMGTRSVTLDETCSATAALSPLSEALWCGFNLATKKQSGMKCHQPEGQSPISENAFRKSFIESNCFSRQNHSCLSREQRVALCQNDWNFKAEQLNVGEKRVLHIHNLPYCGRVLGGEAIFPGTLYRETQTWPISKK